MLTLGLLMLVLGILPSTTAAATGTDTIELKGTVVPQGPIDILKTKLPCCLSDNQRLQNTQAAQPDEPGLGSPEQHHGPPTSVPATHALNDMIPDNLITVMDITHNSSLVLTCKGSALRQVNGAPECNPLTLDDSGDMKDEYSSINQRVIPLHSLVSKPEESVPVMTETNTDANLCKSDQPGFRSATCSQHTSSTEKASYDHQSIVMLQDDPVVQESASFLFEKDPSVSTLLSYQRGALQVIRGTRVRLTSDSHVMLVGHGNRASDGVVLLGGYRAEEVARVVGVMETVDRHLGTVSVLGCELGKELAFATQLLQGLRRLRVEATLHLHLSALSVTRAGELVTREGGEGRPVWRQGDESNKVVAWLDRAGHLLTRVEGSQRGQVIPHYQGQALNGPQYIEKYYKNSKFSAPKWPNQQKPFLDLNLDEEQKEKVNVQCIIDLEALTWGIFHQDFRVEDRVNVKCKYLKGNRDPQNAIRITTLQDVVREIWYHAKKAYKTEKGSEQSDSYYVLNNYLYRVHNEDIYAYLLGKCDPDDEGFLNKHGDHINKQTHTYDDIRKVVSAYDFNMFCDETFIEQSCTTNCAYTGQYFMAAVFAESARNFRNFPLFLMSFAGYKHDQNNYINFYTKETHPMAQGGTWLFKSRRGFHGCSLEDLNHEEKHNSENSQEVGEEAKAKKLQEMVQREIHMFECNYKILEITA